jgi:phosphopentomutase
LQSVYIIVLDSAGIGAAPDAAEYGDAGSATIPHIAAACGGLKVPFLQSLGLGNIPGLLPNGKAVKGVEPMESTVGSFGAMLEKSVGKDTTTGHWEMAGIHLSEGLKLFPHGPPAFPGELVSELEERIGRRIIGNKAASGTEIIEELGPEHLSTGRPIAYTSADSVFQVAAHKEVIQLDELYRICETARDICNRYRVGRVIARPFIGKPGEFRRTDERRDYSLPPPEETILDRLQCSGGDVVTVGKLDDIFTGRGISGAEHVETNDAARKALWKVARELDGNRTLVFANFIDFDMLYGHRRDPAGYGRELEKTDSFLSEFTGQAMGPEDLLMVTADHGNDPTFKGTDHTREFVPLLVYSRGYRPRSLGIRDGFYDVSQTVARLLGLRKMKNGVAFMP